MKCAAIIPARGGSKGVPLKNLRKVGGCRLLVRSILAARHCDLVSETYVSTDCPQLAHAARTAGARVILRPPEISTDEASSEDALIHALGEMAKTGDMPDCVAFLQCTSPFTSSDEIRRVIEPVAAGKADSSFAAAPSHRFIWRLSPDGTVHGANHDHREQRKRRQDLDPEFVETGAIYCFLAKDFLEKRNRFMGRIMAVEIESPSLEIDSPEDLMLAHRAAERYRLPQPPLGQPKVLVTDFDGVHTDGKVHVLEDGREAVVCNRRDGLGIGIAKNNGLEILILSKEQNPVVNARAAKLGIECIHGCDNKLAALSQWLNARGLFWDQIAYVGDDINDLDCLQLAGTSICPADAVATVRDLCDIRLDTAGGDGCVREIVDRLRFT